MPKRKDLKTILVVGAGPIIIGQACEFDYSGTQACKALKDEGYKVILINSNPATIMTDPGVADKTYIEPITLEVLEKILKKEKLDAILPTMGGQTALNLAMEAEKKGILKKYKIELIGANSKAISNAEDRKKFRKNMLDIGLDLPKSKVVNHIRDAGKALKQIGLPAIIRPAFTLGGLGGGIAKNQKEYLRIVKDGLHESPVNQILIEECLEGWKEFEMEVVRDTNDNCIIVCSIENLDPMGIHTGDSITVAPAQTLTDKEYQIMRNASIAVLREIGVETGGSNVQFAVNPDDGRMVVIEMNPRVSRSSALASKATGFPIAKVAAKLAVGYTLDELQNDITRGATPASFEPSIDYVVTKIPRFAFEKFNQANAKLTTQMKSVGEVMAIGRTFQESLHKAIRGLEVGSAGFEKQIDITTKDDLVELRHQLRVAGSERIWYVGDAFRAGMDVSEVFRLTAIDPWFLFQIEDLILEEASLEGLRLNVINAKQLFRLKRKGFSDKRLAALLDVSEKDFRTFRHTANVRPVFKRVDTCAAEFSTSTAYMYSTYEEECEAQPSVRDKILVLGGGPNRIGQGIEFDYCCVHAALAMREDGYETIMVNCNPETVSTDYDVSDRLYFEPLTLEDVLAVIDIERPEGVIVHYGGQTPLKLAAALEKSGAKIIGTTPDSIDLAEDRERFQKMIQKLNLKQPVNGTARSQEEAAEIADSIGFPLVVRPSYVLGGRAMEIVYNKENLERYMKTAVQVSNDSPVLLDSFLDHAIEVDIDVISDGKDIVIGGIMEHIEQAGIHSGDSACSLPPHSLPGGVLNEMRRQVKLMAKELNVIGLMNTQLAYQDGEIYVIEVNPRASRTVPFVSKATGAPIANIAARVMAGVSLEEQNFTAEIIPKHFSVKESVFPFNKFLGVDPFLGPEMRSTGEVMGVGPDFPSAFDKALLAAGDIIPTSGKVLVSLRTLDRDRLVELGQRLTSHGFEIVATRTNQEILKQAGLECTMVNKVSEGSPHIVDAIKNDEISLIINSTEDTQGQEDAAAIRCQALIHKVPCTTTVAAAFAMLDGLMSPDKLVVRSLQSIHK